MNPQVFSMIKKFLLGLKRVIRQNLELSELAFFMLLRQRGRADDRVLVIQNSHLGDFVLSITFFQRLQKHYQRKLVLVSDGGMKDLAMASGLFEDFIALDMKKASSLKHSLYRWKKLFQLRKISAAAVVQLFSVGATDLEDCIAAVIAAPEKYGMVNGVYSSQRWGKRYKWLRRKIFTQVHEYDASVSLLANEKRFSDLICGESGSVDTGSLNMFEPLPPKDVSWGDYLLLIPGSNDIRRRWEAEKFAVLTARAVRKYQLKVVISGSPDEAAAVQSCYDALPCDVKKSVLLRCPQADKLSSLKQLMSDVKHAALVITNDTGPLHLAARFHVRTFCITGGWHWGVFSPCAEYKNVCFIHHKMECYGCGGSCKYRSIPFKCLQELSAEAAADAVGLEE